MGSNTRPKNTPQYKAAWVDTKARTVPISESEPSLNVITSCTDTTSYQHRQLKTVPCIKFRRPFFSYIVITGFRI